MTILRDALLEALGPAFLGSIPEETWEDTYPFIAVTTAFLAPVADAILSDPAFRAALEDAMAEALVTDYDCCCAHDDVKGQEEHVAALTVSRMLGLEEPDDDPA